MLRWSLCGGLLLALLACSTSVRGADPALETSDRFGEGRPSVLPGRVAKPPTKPAASSDRPTAAADAVFPASEEQIRGWIKDLDSATFSVREAATEQLLRTGRSAVEPLTAAVESKSPEVSMRAMRILEQLYQAADTANRSAAQRSLAAIAANPDSPGARRANEILSPPNIVSQPDMMFGGNPFGGGRRRRMGGGGGMGRVATSIQTSVVNGHKKVDADNGPRKVHIEEEPQGAITISVTDIENGQPQTRNFAAKNLDDLTKNQPPEARQLYQQYMAGWAGPFQFRSGAIILSPLP